MKRTANNKYSLFLTGCVIAALMQSCALTYTPKKLFDVHISRTGEVNRYHTDNLDYIYSNHIVCDDSVSKVVDYSIRNGVQQNILLSQILKDYEKYPCFRSSLHYANKRYREPKLENCSHQYELTKLMPAIGYQLRVYYKKINLPYKDLFPLDFYKVEVLMKDGQYYTWRCLYDDTMFHKDGITYYDDIYKKHIYHEVYDSICNNSLRNLLIGVTVHPHSSVIGFTPSINTVDVFYLSKPFYSYYDSKTLLYIMMVQSNRKMENKYLIDSTSDISKWNRYIGLKAIKANREFSYYPFHGNPEKLIPFIYIMSYGDYEPEDVFFEKKHFKQFYYTFRSLRDRKNYRLHYNARNGKFVNYKEIKND